MKRPKILLVSDSALNANGGGISQTLANIFGDFPKDQVLVLSAEEELNVEKDKRFISNTLYFKRQYIKELRNRLGLYINKYLSAFSFYLLRKLPIPHLRKIKEFDADLILICAQGKEGVLMGEKIIEVIRKPFSIYFMDDWFANLSIKWKGGDLHRSIQHLLKEATGWIMISEYLAETISNRFSIYDKPLLVLHNPVDPWTNLSPGTNTKPELDIVYAGALWPMHLDACVMVAKALKNWNKKGHKGNLTLYCREHFWKNNERSFDGLPVVYGGLVAYADMYPTLAKHQFALVCSSFDEENKYLTASSVQTKITDYMNAERVIISIGPDYGACNRFIEQHDIGYTIQSSRPEDIEEKLRSILNDTIGNKERVKKAKDSILNHYNKQAVLKGLLTFTEVLLSPTQKTSH